MTDKQREEFEQITRPVIKWLNDNGHPHMTIEIEPTRATLREDENGRLTIYSIRKEGLDELLLQS